MITMKRVEDVRPRDILSTDGYAVFSICRVRGVNRPDRYAIEAYGSGENAEHCKRALLEAGELLPIWTPDVVS